MPRPFHFVSEAHLVRYTGYKADNLRDLTRALHRVSGPSLFYHLYHALFRRHILLGEFTNDFSRWTYATLREDVLSERLAAVDPLDYETLGDARSRMARLMEEHLGNAEFLVHARRGQEFYFQEASTFAYPTGHVARNLHDFERIVRQVRPDVIFHHFISSRLRLEKQENDFSAWLVEELGERDLAEQVRKLSPYRFNLLTMRDAIGDLVRQELDARAGG